MIPWPGPLTTIERGSGYALIEDGPDIRYLTTHSTKSPMRIRDYGNSHIHHFGWFSLCSAISTGTAPWPGPSTDHQIVSYPQDATGTVSFTFFLAFPPLHYSELSLHKVPYTPEGFETLSLPTICCLSLPFMTLTCHWTIAWTIAGYRKVCTLPRYVAYVMGGGGNYWESRSSHRGVGEGLPIIASHILLICYQNVSKITALLLDEVGKQ
jgi:hypothetical protein